MFSVALCAAIFSAASLGELWAQGTTNTRIDYHRDYRTKPIDYRARSGQAAASNPRSNYQKLPDGYSAAPKEKPQAAPAGYHVVSSGTGFFVSNRGYVITNNHVIEGCSTAMIRGAVNPVDAQVVAVDKENDLALLKTTVQPQRTATMRISDKSVRVGDPVMVMGYPQEHGISGVYKVMEASVVGMQGPLNEPTWIQFTSSAQQGNSGGPLLDTSGNVIGVIVGKTKLFRKVDGKQEAVKESDVAISLPVLKKFLDKNNIFYRSNYSESYLATSRLENQAKDYIVNIHCNKGAEQAAAK
ncbi:MAG: trypsin-like peptidase domain-containing protein [Alphaproteobacteria bacterium]|nr:trypsin-like peptidase domain-containing protein [Alphaproteobacteria bacterium]